MMRTTLLSLCVFVFTAMPKLHAQQDSSSEGMSKAAVKAGPEYMGLIREASVDFVVRRNFDAAEAKLDEADKIKPGLFDSIKMRGAIYAERRDFVRAKEMLEKALTIQPNALLPKFNLAEVLLMQKKFAEAREGFEAIVGQGRVTEVVQFKIIITYLGEGNDAKSRELIDHIKFPGDTAAYYYANAGWEFAHGNAKKANEFLDTANSIFGPSRNFVFYDTLADMGWVSPRHPIQSPAK